MGTSASTAGRDEALGSDQRQSPRKIVSKPIPVELQPGQESWIHDLGEGGLSISGSAPLELGISTTLRFELPEAHSVIDASGVVAWSDESGRAGVRFTQIARDSTAALRKWLNSGASAPAHSDSSNDLAEKVACLREVADLQAIISSERLEAGAALDLIVRRMAELTRATGAAIALRAGHDVVCRASFGTAPGVGVKLSPSSLSGECLRSGAIVMLEDSENDSRVNPEVCRQFNFRSLLILPVTSGTETLGIAEVLSPNLRNFEGGDVLVLSFLTDLVASIAAPREEVPPPEYSDLKLLPLLESSGIGDIQPSVNATPPAERLSAVQTVSAPLSAVSAFPMEHAVPANTKFQHVEKGLPIRVQARSLRISVVGILLLGAALLLLLGYYYRHSRASTKPNIPPTSALPTASPIPSSLQPASSTLSTAPPSIPGKEAKTSRAPRPASVPPMHVSKPAANELAVIQGHTVSATPAPEATAPEPLTISALSSARSPNSLTAAVLAAKTATPELGPNQSQGVVPGKLIKRVLPLYPDMARRAGVSGDVVLAGIIRTDGALRNLKVVSGSPLLREAALDAARQWRYSPYLLGGKPVEAETHITVSFHP